MSVVTARPPARPVRPSSHPGMGAVLARDAHGAVTGTTFRVWAPNADAAWVTGPFRHWGEGVPLARENDAGYWSAFVPGVGAGTAYKFRLRRGGDTLLRNDPYARCVTNSAGDSVVYDPAGFDWEGDAFTPPPLDDLVVYELHVGTFGGEGGRVGTLDDAAAHLDYLVSLGVSAVELMPVAEFAGDRSWGYNVAYPFAVESAYGGPDALKRFVKAAHRRGIAVVLDVVYNHFGPGDLDLWRFDGAGDDPYGGIYFYNDDRAETPWGTTRPDYGRPEVRQYLRDNARYWLEEFRVDGLRLDMALYIRNRTADVSPENCLPDGWSLLQWITDEVHRDFPGRVVIAEDLQQDPALVAPTAEGGAGFDAQWDAAFVHPVRAALEAADDGARHPEALAAAVGHRYGADAFRRVVYTESHDEVANGRQRLVSEVGDPWYGAKRATLAAALVMTAPGVPMLFQGQATLEEGWFQDDVPLDWSRPETAPGVVALWRDLVALRRDRSGRSAGLRGQGYAVLRADDGVLAFHRWRDGDGGGVNDSVVVVVNLRAGARGDVDVPFPAPGPWALAFNSDAKVYHPDFTDAPSADVHAGEDGHAAVRVGPYAALVYVRPGA